jgi:AraC-like DNA-binding protein
MELLYVHQGHGRAIVEQQFVELSRGALVYYRPFQLHRMQMDISPEQPYVRTLIVFEPSAILPFLKPFPALDAFFEQMWKDPLAPQIITGLDADKMEQLIRTYDNRIHAAPADELLEEQALFIVAFLHAVRSSLPNRKLLLPGTGKTPSKPSTTAELIMQWLESHYTEPFELDKLAQAVHLSPNHVSALFRQAVGSSITEYITARRIRQACVLLKTTDMSVQDIGQTIGLSNFSYFCQLFRKHVGMSPHKFRQRVHT